MNRKLHSPIRSFQFYYLSHFHLDIVGNFFYSVIFILTFTLERISLGRHTDVEFLFSYNGEGGSQVEETLTVLRKAACVGVAGHLAGAKLLLPDILLRLLVNLEHFCAVRVQSQSAVYSLLPI